MTWKLFMDRYPMTTGALAVCATFTGMMFVAPPIIKLWFLWWSFWLSASP